MPATDGVSRFAQKLGSQDFKDMVRDGAPASRSHGCIYSQLADFRIRHAWSGNVAVTLDGQPHFGNSNGLHYALGCNGVGIGIMRYMGTRLAQKIAGLERSASVFEDTPLPCVPLCSGNPQWIIPVMGNAFRIRGWIDRRRS